MEIKHIHELSLNTEETIVATSIANSEEWVMLMSKGDIIRYNAKNKKEEALFSVKSDIGYTDGGFDINAPSTIYTMDSIIVIVNDYKRHGYIHYPGKYHKLHLWREDYYADISRYSIALFKDSSNVPHIIYAVAWNHLQIMNLDTRQVITASKSLIEEFAEEKHMEQCKRYPDGNKLPWPSEYDYFYGNLQISPNNINFLSEGWAWGSSDSYNIYEISHFISSNRIAHKSVMTGEHCNRSACWIDDTTVVVTCNPYNEGDATEKSPCEIHFYKMDNKESEIVKKIPIPNLDILNAKIQYNKMLNAFVIFSDNIGLAIISLEGDILLRAPDFRPDQYHSDKNLFLKVNDKSISAYQII